MAATDYLNIAVRDTPDALEKRLAALPVAAYVATVPGGIVLYPEPGAALPDLGDFLATQTTRNAGSTVLLSEVRDDVLRLRLFVNGASVDEYVAETEGDGGGDGKPTGGDASALLAAFGAPRSDSEFLEPLLRAPRFDDDYGYGAASDRHAEIADLLDIPQNVGIGYEGITQGKLPEGVAAGNLRRVPGNGLRVWQFTLLRVPEGTSEGETASYLLPEVVSLERGIETDDWVSDFGTRADVLRQIAALAGDAGGDPAVVSTPDGSLTVDLGFGADTDHVEIIHAFLLGEPGGKIAALSPLLAVAQTVGATVWDWETRRVLQIPT